MAPLDLRFPVFDQDLLHGVVEAHVHARVLQMLLQLLIDLIAFLRPEMADGTLHKL